MDVPFQTTRILLSGLCVAAAATALMAASDEEQSQEEAPYIDAVVAAGDYYKLLSEDGNLRVIEMNLPAGAQDNLHSHNHETVYFLSGGKARIHVGDQVVDAEIPDGHVMHHGPWTHSVQNVGDTAIHAIIFERMEAAAVEATEGYVDAAVAAAAHYKVLSTAEAARVVHMKLGAGERDETHSHHQETVYFLSGGKAKIHVGDEVVDAEVPDGHVMHHGPWTHSVENVGDSVIEAIIFEQLPSKPAKGS